LGGNDQVKTINEAISVLLVEDDPEDVAFLQMAAREAGVPFKFTVMEDGEQALRFLLELKNQSPEVPDLIVLDMNVPQVDGPLFDR
jgi:CheY-like chemotaxis protein